ncbi:MAG: hypothetical protein ACLFS1_10785 [Opitutales bacterium]
MSRVVGGEMLLGVREKEVFRKMLWQVADFSGVCWCTGRTLG